MRTKVFLLTPLACACVGALAQTLPTGGAITQGSGSVTVNGSGMTVNQGSQRLVADWQSFSIGAANSVRFVQPSADAVALNRVLGSDPSRIFGSLTANGHVYLQNPNGVLFAPGAQVDVGSLVATSLNTDVQQFMAGRLRLAGGSPASGSVINEGSITSAAGGHVVLAAPQVGNSGSIVTLGGTTALAAGYAVNVDPTGSGLLNISVPVAAVNAQLSNSGTISADGGLVTLQAAATDAALRSVMQVGGVVRARSIEQRDGQILLSGGTSGVVAVNGTLDASGSGETKGGTVKVLGDRVALLGSATVDASGGVGGGTVLIGGNYQGKGPEANAQATYVGSGALIDASAHERGDGGKVVVWSDGATTYGGNIAARGGASGGDGGSVEVSGKQQLNFLGEVDTRAPAGKSGSLLLDPFNLEVGLVADIDGIAPTGDDLVNSPLLYADFGFAPTSRITAARVATLLGTGSVVLQASNSLNVTAPITVAAGGAASTLTLNSPVINLGAPITLNNASLVADTNQNFSDSILVTAALQSLNSVALTSNDIFLDDATITAPNVTLTAGNATFSSMGQTGPSGIIANTLTIARLGATTSTVTLDGNLNRVGVLDVTASTTTININNLAGAPVQVRGSTGPLTLSTNTAITQGAAATDALVVNGAFNLTTTGTGAVALTNAANDFVGNVTFNVGGSLDMIGSKDPLRASGTAGGDVTLVSSNLAFFLTGNISVAAGAGIDITGNGFNNSAGGLLQVQPGGRFFIRSSDFQQDVIGPIGFSAAGIGNINNFVLGGWTGAAPTTGNSYFTNRTGSITAPNADAPPISRVYDATTGFTFTQTGTAANALIDNGVSVPTSVPLGAYTIGSTGTFLDKNVGTDKGYTVAASNNVVATDSSNGSAFYGLAYAGFTRPAGPAPTGPGNAVSVVTPRAITSNGITAVGRVYDGTTTVALNTGGVALNGVIGGDGVVLGTTGATGAVGNKNVGVAKPVLVSGLVLSGADAGNYTITDASGATATITARPVTSTGFTAVDRVYDGSTGVAVVASAATLTGAIGGDAVAVSGGTGAMANKNAGVGKPVTISAVTLAGADAGNYSVTDASGATVDIAVRPITSTGITGVDRVYDGTTTVALNTSGATLNNTVAGDTVTLLASGASGTMADKNVGTAKPVTSNGLTLGGTDAANYSLTDTSAATVNISALALTPAGITAVNRGADGTTAVALDTSGATVVGVLSGDVVTLDASGAVGSVATPDPGAAKQVFVSGLTLGGTDAVNYSILATPIGPSGQGLTVRILSVAAAAFEDIRYKEYLQGVSDAQEPFRRAMAEALAAGFGKENIRKQLTRGLVFETGLAPPAVDNIGPAAPPPGCTAAGAGLGCAR